MWSVIISKTEEEHSKVKDILAANYTGENVEIVKDVYPMLIVQSKKPVSESTWDLVVHINTSSVVTALKKGIMDCIIDQIHVIKVHATLFHDLQEHLATQSVCLEPMEYMLPV